MFLNVKHTTDKLDNLLFSKDLNAIISHPLCINLGTF